MRAGVAVAARYASPALALAAATRDESLGGPDGRRRCRFRPAPSLMFDCPCCCDLTRLRLLVASPPVRDLLFFAKDLFVAARTVRHGLQSPRGERGRRGFGRPGHHLRVLVMLGLGRDRHRRQNHAQDNASDHEAKQ
jgi:hypothetical protein